MFDIVAAPIPNAAGIKEPVMANSADPTDLRPGIVILRLIDGDGSKMQYCAKAGLDKAVRNVNLLDPGELALQHLVHYITAAAGRLLWR